MTKQKQVRTIDVLREARGLVANKKTWARLWYAFDAEGRRVGWQYIDGTVAGPPIKWCALGAIYKSSQDLGLDVEPSKLEGMESMESLIRALGILSERVCGTPCLTEVNDGPNGRKRVLKVIDAAIQELKSVEA